MDLVIASRNPGKIQELSVFLHHLPLRLLSLDDFPGAPKGAETGTSFTENALLKAWTISHYTGQLTLADDSGLEVLALGGRPGVLSARYAGPNATAGDNNQRLLSELEGLPLEKRQARFVCVIALVNPRGLERVMTGTCDGAIALEPRGQSGFGYDPLFIVGSQGKTFAELTLKEKGALSHRGRALQVAHRELTQLIKGP